MTRTNGQQAERALPHDLLAEAHLLGAAMLDQEALESAIGVPVADFYKPAHAHVASVLRELHAEGQAVDPVTVGHRASQRGLLAAVGGSPALVELMAQAPATSNAAEYARIVCDLAGLRRLVSAAGEIAETALTASDPGEALATAEKLLDEVGAGASSAGEVELVPASTITPARPAWAWADRIPLAGVTLIPGREGEGKTALVAHLAARWSRGDLPGELYGRPTDVVYVGHEDDRASVLVPRLMAAGADLDRFLFVDLRDGGTFTITRSLDALTRQLTHRQVAAVIVDPLDAHLGVTDSHKKADVQAAIARLAALTQQHRCAGVGIAHLNKGDATDVLLKVVGSVGLTTSVRSVLAIGPHPNQPETEKVAVVRKANMTNAGEVPAVRFRVESTEIPAPDGNQPIRTARVVLLGEEDGIHADSILSVGDAEGRSALEEACEWLRAMLSDGPMLKRDVVRASRAESINDMTLKRAARQLDIISERDDSQQGRPATWSLPGYGSRVSGQPDVTRNLQGSDQAEQGRSEGFGSRLDHDPKPGTNGSGPTRDCTRCGQPATDISGLCADCISGRREADR